MPANNNIKVPSGLKETFFEFITRWYIKSMRIDMTSPPTELRQFWTIFLPLALVTNIALRAISFIISRVNMIFESELGLLLMTLSSTVFFIELVRSECSLKKIYEGGKVSIIRSLAENGENVEYYPSYFNQNNETINNTNVAEST